MLGQSKINLLENLSEDEKNIIDTYFKDSLIVVLEAFPKKFLNKVFF